DGEPIAIFGDYDVDGTSAAALLHRYFSELGARPDVHIPDRAEGYGPSRGAFSALCDRGAKVLITVDCGSNAPEETAYAEARGVHVIVIDHHQMSAPPPAHAVVNPQRADDASGLGDLTASGLAFLFAVAVSRRLRAEAPDRPAPDLMRLIDLAMLGTICDVAPLQGFNRALALQGLKVASQRGNAGLAALCAVAGADDALSAQHVGFQIGPRLNAAGRMGRARDAFDLLVEDDPDMAARKAQGLDGLNQERRALEADIFDRALGVARPQAEAGAPVLVASGDGWPAGVLGIVAGRLSERFDRPAIVIGFEDAEEGEDARGSGSARSIDGVDVGGAISAAAREGLLIAGGGHAAAAGLTIARSQLDAFARNVRRRLDQAVETASEAIAFEIDSVVSGAGASIALSDAMRRAAPFGAGNPEPIFAAASVRIEHARIVGERHVAATMIDAAGARLRGIAFRAVGSSLGDALLASGDRRLHVAGALEPDAWRGGRAVQMRIEDAAWSNEAED
ncbi:MAG: single-stranded-DNA-specific exonuclease RecJ, partial [Pseudomonadota bacterium]